MTSLTAAFVFFLDGVYMHVVEVVRYQLAQGCEWCWWSIWCGLIW